MAPGPQAVSRLPLSIYHSPRSAVEPVEPVDSGTATVDERTGSGLFPSPEFMPEEMPAERMSREQIRTMRAELRGFLAVPRLPAGMSDEEVYQQYRDFRQRS